MVNSHHQFDKNDHLFVVNKSQGMAHHTSKPPFTDSDQTKTQKGPGRSYSHLIHVMVPCTVSIISMLLWCWVDWLGNVLSFIILFLFLTQLQHKLQTNYSGAISRQRRQICDSILHCHISLHPIFLATPRTCRSDLAYYHIAWQLLSRDFYLAVRAV